MNNQQTYQMVYNQPTAQYFNPQMSQAVQQQQQQLMYQYPTYQYTPGRYINNTIGARPQYQGHCTQPNDPQLAYQQPQQLQPPQGGSAPIDHVYLHDIYGKLESLKRAFEGAHLIQKESLDQAAVDQTRITKLESEVAKLKAELEEVISRQVQGPEAGSLPAMALRNPIPKEGETEVAEFGKTTPLFSGLLQQLEKARSQAAIPSSVSPVSTPEVTLGRQLSEEGEVEEVKVAEVKGVKGRLRPNTRQSARANRGEVGNARKRIKRERFD